MSVIDNLVTGNIKLVNKKASFHKCDISDKKKIKEILNNKQFDIVMHFAGADEKLRSGLISKHSTHLIKIDSEFATKKKMNLSLMVIIMTQKTELQLRIIFMYLI